MWKGGGAMKKDLAVLDGVRFCFFVMQTQMRNGEYVALVATEGESGYRLTDWTWGSDFTEAEKVADLRNERMGICKRDAIMIQLRSMRRW
jgi:hypothetical protein